MIRASVRGPDGPLIVAGLSERNIELLKEGKPIVASLRSFSVDLPGRLLILYGKTEDAIANNLRQHGDVIDADAVMQAEAEALGLGATGDYPDGKLHESDEGGLQMAMTPIPGFVIFNFGKPVAWLSIKPVEARMMARKLDELASRAEVLAREKKT